MSMRRSILTFVTLLSMLGLSAQPISEQEAFEKARRFFNGKTVVSLNQKAAVRGSASERPYKHLYLFNAEGDGGFVIIAGDSRAQEVLGYSHEGRLDYSRMPEDMKWWLSLYDESIAHIASGATAESTLTRADEKKPDVAPMMSFSWDQTAPYNYYCPSGCLAGCVPLAMAQMMAFHKYPTNLPALEGYTDKNGIKLDALQANYVDYDNMSDYDPAVLVRYCGQAVKANYSSQMTTSYSGIIPVALANQFGFDKGVRCAYRKSYNSTEWDDLLYSELSSGRPFILAGQKNGDKSDGHAFICHGYSEGYYAVNWGYGGMENGYFAMTNLTVGGQSYNTELTAVIGIQPPAGNKRDFPLFSISKMEAVSQLQVTRASAAADFTDIRLSWIIENTLLEDTKVQVAIALFKPDGTTDLMYPYDPFTFETTTNAYAEAVFNLASKYGDGIYRFNIIYKMPDDDTWHFCQGNYWRYVQAEVSGNTLTLTNYPDYDAPYPTGPYPPFYPINPDYPDTPDDPEPEWPAASVTIDYPTMKAQYAEEYIEVNTEWNTLADLIQSQTGMTATDFDNYYWADCIEDNYYTDVPNEDAPYVTPWAYNYNSEGGYENNWYDMKIFNFGSDDFGNGGTPPTSGEESAEAEPEWELLAVAAYSPNMDTAGNHVITYQLGVDAIKFLIDGQTSPVTFTRWVRFAAKDKGGIVEALCRYVWLKLPLEISWGGDGPDGITAVATDKPGDECYDLRGLRMKSGTSLRKGIYIRNGKKFVVK